MKKKYLTEEQIDEIAKELVDYLVQKTMPIALLNVLDNPDLSETQIRIAGYEIAIEIYTELSLGMQGSILNFEKIIKRLEKNSQDSTV